LAILVPSAECKHTLSSLPLKTRKKWLRTIWYEVVCMWAAARLQAKGGDDVAERWTGSSRWQRDEDMSGSRKITLIWYKKDICGDDWTHLKTCYCCLTLPDRPCYIGQQYCWYICPRLAPHQLSPAASPAVSGFKFWLYYTGSSLLVGFQQ
jgi:hypothetical protein